MPGKNGGVIGGKLSANASASSGIWDMNDNQQNASTWPTMVVPKLWNNLALRWATPSSGIGRPYPGSQAEYAAASGAVIPATAGYTFNAGYHYFDITEGNYTVDICGAEGSGTQHGYGAIITASMTVVTTTRMVAIVGNPASGSYGAGGMSALALRNAASDIYTSATALLVAGGGGGGWSSLNSESDGGNTSWTPTTRRGQVNNGVYDGGASFLNNYNPEIYYSSSGGQGSTAAQHWVWGALGGTQGACGPAGAFGGGGGGCPAGGGGYYGGKPGDGGYSGGGGTSYRLSSGAIAYISAWSDNGTNGSTRNANPGTAGGQLTITAVA